MVRTKRASSTLKKFISQSKERSGVNKKTTAHSSKAASFKKKSVTEDDAWNEIFSDIENNVQNYIEEDLESPEDSEVNEPILNKSKLIHNKRNANVRKKRKQLGVLREIRKYQRSTELLIPKASFARVCKDIFQRFGGLDFRVAKTALECLQEAAENFLVQFFEDSYLCTLHAQRSTLMNKDLRLARRIGGRSGLYS